MNRLKRKRSSSTNTQPQWNKGLCHIKTNVQGKLTPFTGKSWRKFEESCGKRKDEIWLLMKDQWMNGPRGGYHRKCYQEYTYSGKLKRSRPTDNEPKPPSVSSKEDTAFAPTEVPGKVIQCKGVHHLPER